MLSTLVKAASPIQEFFVTGVLASPWVYAWRYRSDTGYGTRYANPATLPGQTPTGVAVHPNGTAVAIGVVNFPYVIVYRFSSSGWGTQYASPSTALTSGGGLVKFSPDGTKILISTSASPHLTVYEWSESTGFGAKFANPATLLPRQPWDMAWAPDGNSIITCEDALSGPWVHGYPWSASGFGTKFANPATPLPGSAYSVAINPSSNAFSISSLGGSVFTIYSYLFSSSGFGTRYAATSPQIGSSSSRTYGMVYSPDGNFLLVTASGTGGGTTSIFGYNWTNASGIGTRITDPVGITGITGNSTFSPAFPPSGTAIGFQIDATNITRMVRWSSSGFGSSYSTPTTSGGRRGGVAFGKTTT